jgi:heme exporter protein C
MPLLALGAALTTVAFVLAFTTAPLVLGASTSAPAMVGGQMVANRLLLSQKIFYFHVPVALLSFACLLATAAYGLLFLLRRDQAFDLRGQVSTELALTFILMTMASGEMWERYEWGVWWTWEPRLTTYFIMMLMVIGYFVLRSAVIEAERRATYCAAFGIIAFINALISLIVTRLVPSGVHPVIFRTDSGLPPLMLTPFLLALLGMATLAFGLYRLRLRQQSLAERLTALMARLDD